MRGAGGGRGRTMYTSRSMKENGMLVTASNLPGDHGGAVHGDHGGAGHGSHRVAGHGIRVTATNLPRHGDERPESRARVCATRLCSRAHLSRLVGARTTGTRPHLEFCRVQSDRLIDRDVIA